MSGHHITEDRERCRAARAIIRSGLDDTDRDLLLAVAGLCYEDAAPLPSLGTGRVADPPPRSTRRTTIELVPVEPIVPKKAMRNRSAEGDRKCSMCQETKPAGEFYAGRYNCKACHQKVNGECQIRRRASSRPKTPRSPKRAGRPRKPRPGPGEKECSRCRATKPVDEFCVDKRRPDGLGSVCRDCHNKARRAGGRIEEAA